MPVQAKILIIDDDPGPVIDFYKKAVGDDHRYDKDPDIIRRPEDVSKERLDKIDIIILDFIFENSPHNGSYVLNLIKNYNRNRKEIFAKIILLSSMKNYSQWDEKLKLKGLFNLGVTDFILRSVAEDFPEIFKFQLDRALEFLENAETISAQHKDIQSHYRIKAPTIIGQSGEMHRVTDYIERAAKTDSNVLITGESGTGKEIVARTIHCMSKRSKGPFVGINCSAMPSNLIESELFGHEKGAFTGADFRKIGHFEKANGGTIFLDEVAEMETNLQVKLNRVIQERRIERVGGIKPIDSDVRIIAATNKNLREAVSKGNLREDLLYRLNVLHIHIPPLRNRLDDIEPLATHFLEKKNREIGKGIHKISHSTFQKLKNYSWPGNVRELENVIERAIVMATGPEISEDDIHIGETPRDDRSLGMHSSGAVFFDAKGIAAKLIEDRDKAKALFEEKYGHGQFVELEDEWETSLESRTKYLGLRQFKLHNNRNFTAEQKLLIKGQIEKYLREVEKISRITDKLVSIAMGMSHRSLRGMLSRERKKKEKESKKME